MHTFLKNLQNSPEHVKGRWLFGLTAIAMVVVIFTWLSYFNTLIEPEFGLEEEIVLSVSQKTSVFGTMKDGAGALGESVTGAIKSIGGIFGVSREYTIEPE